MWVGATFMERAFIRRLSLTNRKLLTTLQQSEGKTTMNAHGRYIIPCRGLSYTYISCVYTAVHVWDYYMPCVGFLRCPSRLLGK